jgi:hypothetical protein
MTTEALRLDIIRAALDATDEDKLHEALHALTGSRRETEPTPQPSPPPPPEWKVSFTDKKTGEALLTKEQSAALLMCSTSSLTAWNIPCVESATSGVGVRLYLKSDFRGALMKALKESPSGWAIKRALKALDLDQLSGNRGATANLPFDHGNGKRM